MISTVQLLLLGGLAVAAIGLTNWFNGREAARLERLLTRRLGALGLTLVARGHVSKAFGLRWWAFRSSDPQLDDLQVTYSGSRDSALTLSFKTRPLECLVFVPLTSFAPEYLVPAVDEVAAVAAAALEGRAVAERPGGSA